MNTSASNGQPTLRSIAVGAVITAVISGLIGAAITWYVQRAKPNITLISVGFRGPLNIDTIDVGDDLSLLTTQTGAISTLKRFESFDKLAATEQKASEELILIDQSISAVETWRKRYALPPQDGQSRRLSAQAVSDHPFASDELVGETLVSLLHDGEHLTPPIPLAEIQKMQNVIPFGEVKKNIWMLVYGRRQHKIAADEQLPEVQVGIQLLANSFASGSYENIDYYSAKYIEEARTELDTVRKISDKLRETILPNAVISARLLIENRGGQAITFNPNFALHFKDKSAQLEPIILRASPQRDNKKNPFKLNAEGFSIAIPTGEEEGKKAQVKPFLPDPDSYPYINVPPGEIKEVSVTGSSPLGNLTKELLTMYESKLLRFSISGSTVAGTRVESSTTSFSEHIGEDEKRLLQAN